MLFRSTAVLTCAFPVLLRSRTSFFTPVVRAVELVGRPVILGTSLMAQRRRAGVQVPWCLGNVFCMTVWNQEEPYAAGHYRSYVGCEG